jgi:hypothetical protein
LAPQPGAINFPVLAQKDSRGERHGRGRNESMTSFMITVDVEFSIGGHFQERDLNPVDQDRHIYCIIDGKDYGIGLIMTILEKHGFHGVFFIETEARFYFGEATMEKIIRSIVDRGHEVQLHVHPVFRAFEGGNKRPEKRSDNMDDYPLEEQVRIIGEGKAFLEKASGRPVSAFRSGSYRANWDTVAACERNGIRYFSNYNLAIPGCLYGNDFPGMNGPFELRPGLYEFPITAFKESGGRKEWNPFQICSASDSEMRKASQWYSEGGIGCLTFITHSFEFVTPDDYRYTSMRPNHLHIRRLEKLCGYFRGRPESFANATFSSLAGMKVDGPFRGKPYQSTIGDVAFRYFQNSASRYWPA